MLVNACLVNFSSISAKAVSLIKKHITYSDLRKTTNVSTPNCLLTLSGVSLLVHVSWITAEVFLLITKPIAQEDMAFISKHEVKKVKHEFDTLFRVKRRVYVGEIILRYKTKLVWILQLKITANIG